jgi:hypothetical protein
MQILKIPNKTISRLQKSLVFIWVITYMIKLFQQFNRGTIMQELKYTKTSILRVILILQTIRKLMIKSYSTISV